MKIGNKVMEIAILQQVVEVFTMCKICTFLIDVFRGSLLTFFYRHFHVHYHVHYHVQYSPRLGTVNPELRTLSIGAWDTLII